MQVHSAQLHHNSPQCATKYEERTNALAQTTALLTSHARSRLCCSAHTTHARMRARKHAHACMRTALPLRVIPSPPPPHPPPHQHRIDFHHSIVHICMHSLARKHASAQTHAQSVQCRPPHHGRNCNAIHTQTKSSIKIYVQCIYYTSRTRTGKNHAIW